MRTGTRACLVATAVISCLPLHGGIQPVGANVGPVQFDAVIRLNPPLAPNHVLLFARDRVASNFYQAAVVWAEPQGRHLWFPIYPPTLSVGSDGQSFTITNQAFPSHNTRYAKPLGARGAFDNMFGDYPIGKIRFAEEEAIADEVARSNLADFGLSEAPTKKSYKLPAPAPGSGVERKVVSVEVEGKGDSIDSLRLLGEDNHLLRQITYDYDIQYKPARLTRETVFQPERPVIAALQNGALSVKTSRTNYDFNKFDAVHEPGGRYCTVDYAPVTLGNAIVRLPARIQVRATADGEVIRSVEMTNFQAIHITADEAQRRAGQFADFSPDECEYRALLQTYWGKAPEAISPEGVSAIKRLREDFSKDLPETSGLGERLKRWNILMDLDRMIGDDRQTNSYRAYLSLLANHGLADMVLDGGYERIETAISRGRHHEADQLLDCWLDEAVKSADAQSALKFAWRQVPRANLLAPLCLLQRYDARASLTDGEKFEVAAFRCLLINGLQKLLAAGPHPKSAFPKAQAAWAASRTSPESLSAALSGNLAGARLRFAALKAPTKPQTDLNARVQSLNH